MSLQKGRMVSPPPVTTSVPMGWRARSWRISTSTEA
jgi:hypothetical protein